LLFLAKKMGLNSEKERTKWQILKEDSFNSLSKKMSVVVKALNVLGYNLNIEDLRGIGREILKAKYRFKVREGFNLERLRIPKRIFEENKIEVKTASSKKGKAIGKLIARKKSTSGKENKILKNAIETADASNIDNIVTILYSVNAFEFTRQIAKNESQKALESIENIPESDYLSALKLLCELSLNRTS